MSNRPHYGFVGLKEGMLTQQDDRIIRNLARTQVKMTPDFLGVQYDPEIHPPIARPIAPGEGYRLVEWNEIICAEKVEVTEDGLVWNSLVGGYACYEFAELFQPSEDTLCQNGFFLAARVPVNVKSNPRK